MGWGGGSAEYKEKESMGRLQAIQKMGRPGRSSQPEIGLKDPKKHENRAKERNLIGE